MKFKLPRFVSIWDQVGDLTGITPNVLILAAERNAAAKFASVSSGPRKRRQGFPFQDNRQESVM